METYPTIPKQVTKAPIIAFDKIDGSNIRAEWTRKGGFSKFGTRRRLLDPSEPVLGEAIELFNAKYAADLERIFRKQRLEKVTAFFEFFGPSSFAGFHVEEERHDVVFFDLHVFKKGMMAPKEFLKLFEDKIELPSILYRGTPTHDFMESVKNSELEGMTFEGVVCKGGYDSRGRLVVFKVKSQAWLDALKNKFEDRPDLFEKYS